MIDKTGEMKAFFFVIVVQTTTAQHKMLIVKHKHRIEARTEGQRTPCYFFPAALTQQSG